MGPDRAPLGLAADRMNPDPVEAVLVELILLNLILLNPIRLTLALRRRSRFLLRFWHGSGLQRANADRHCQHACSSAGKKSSKRFQCHYEPPVGIHIRECRLNCLMCRLDLVMLCCRLGKRFAEWQISVFKAFRAWPTHSVAQLFDSISCRIVASSFH